MAGIAFITPDLSSINDEIVAVPQPMDASPSDLDQFVDVEERALGEDEPAPEHASLALRALGLGAHIREWLIGHEGQFVTLSLPALEVFPDVHTFEATNACRRS
jgi:hypothetical protein